MFKFHGIVKEADVYMSRMKRKKFLRKSENVLILSRRKEKHVQRMNALSKKKYKMNYFPDEHDPKAKTYIIRVPGTPEEDRKRIAKYMKAALNKEAEDKASKKEQRKKDWAKVKSSWSDLKRDWPQLGKKWRASKQQSPLLAHESPDTSKTYIHKRVHDTQLAVTPPAKSEVLIAKLNKSPKSK